mgnify:CR=1 FL=1
MDNSLCMVRWHQVVCIMSIVTIHWTNCFIITSQMICYFWTVRLARMMIFARPVSCLMITRRRICITQRSIQTNISNCICRVSRRSWWTILMANNNIWCWRMKTEIQTICKLNSIHVKDSRKLSLCLFKQTSCSLRKWFFSNLK